MMPAAVHAQAAPAAARAFDAATVDLSELIPGLAVAADVSQSLVPLSLLQNLSRTSAEPFSGPPPPVQCIPDLISGPDSFSAFPPDAICQ